MKKAAVDRSKVVSLRLSQEELRLLMAAAERMYLPLSAYLRHRLFSDQYQAVPARPMHPKRTVK